MRDAYFDQLDAIVDDLVAMSQLVQGAVRQATRSLVTADAAGVVHIPLTNAGPWMLRSAYVSKRPGAPSEFDVARATYVFGVAAKH